jgi:hypothetical protein
LAPIVAPDGSSPDKRHREHRAQGDGGNARGLEPERDPMQCAIEPRGCDEAFGSRSLHFHPIASSSRSNDRQRRDLLWRWLEQPSQPAAELVIVGTKRPVAIGLRREADQPARPPL